MGARELYVEHRYKGRFMTAVRLNHKRSRYVLGSGQGSDLRLAGQDISGIHAAFLKEKDGWKIVDLGSESGITVDGKKSLEEELSSNSTIKLGEHEFRVCPRREVVPLYKADRKSSGSLTHQEIVLVFKDRVEESQFLQAGKSFTYLYDGKDITLAPAQSDAWTVTDYGPFQVRHRLCPMPSELGRDLVMEVDRDLVKALGLTVLMICIALPMMSLVKMFNIQAKPEENKVAQMIYDAKIIQKKREKSTEVRTKMAGHNNAANTEVEKPAAGNVRVGKATVSTKVISNIKASGLSQLIGKIAVRAGNTAVAIQSNGSVTNNDHARGVVSGSTIAGKFETAKGTGYKASGISTGGKAGGNKGYADGADMAVGSVGSGEVGLIDEESVVEGGLDREVISAVIKENLGQIRYCYERNLSANPDLNGKVQVKFTIAAPGTVSAQEIGTSTLKNAMVEGCILRRIARWKFPQPKGGTSVVVTYPFLFKALN
jgi:pSer/pThr/pTyr-binding forkhead associated (FHA) protein